MKSWKYCIYKVEQVLLVICSLTVVLQLSNGTAGPFIIFKYICWDIVPLCVYVWYGRVCTYDMTVCLQWDKHPIPTIE